MKKQQILLDMDGVIADFLGGALKVLNRDFNKSMTIEQYATEFGQWGTYDYYGITQEQFWESIDKTPDFWYRLEPMPWGRDLYKFLKEFGEVTIVTTPNLHPDCASQKLKWLNGYLGIQSNEVFLGARKYLMAGNGILIDDYHKNISSFKEAGGEAILIPSNWNTIGLTFDKIKDVILDRE
jgi:5'(3')-deoxyribonucleotidase